METEDMILLGAIAAGGYFIYKATKPITDTIGGVGGGVSSAVGGVGGGIGQIGDKTGSNYGKVADALGDALASDISLLDLKKDAAGVINLIKKSDGGEKSKTILPPVNKNFTPNIGAAPNPLVKVVAPKTGTLSPIMDSVIQKPVLIPSAFKSAIPTTKPKVIIGKIAI